jgi:nucleoid DNA-binding protein
MNLREWARVTHQTLDNQPAEFRPKDFSTADIEMILRMGIRVLVISLDQGGDLRLNALGRLWVEEMQPRHVISNLNGKAREFKTRHRRKIRFQASSRLLDQLNTPE